MQGGTEAVVTIATAIVGVALLAILVSQKSNTTGVVQAFGSAFTNALGVAESPVTGSSFTPSGAYPSSNTGSQFGSLPQVSMLNY
jgi:predicted PhzF superfamily epimerase YddE/YHI9